MKLSKETTMYINNIIDMRSPLTDSDFEYLTASIILATPPKELPAIDDFDYSMKLIDMLAGYMKSLDPDKGQDILDYMANNAVKYFTPVIRELINERYDASLPARIEPQQIKHQQEYAYEKDRI